MENGIRMNRRGLLAVFMALAMVFAGAFITLNVDDVDATLKDNPTSGIPETIGTDTYLVSEDITFDIPSTTVTTGLVVEVGKTVVVKAASTSARSIITVYAEDGETEDKYNDARSITVKSISEKAATITISNDGGTLKVSSSDIEGAAEMFELETTAGTSVVEGTMVSSDGIENIGYGVLVVTNDPTYTFYGVGATLSEQTLDGSITVKDGSVSIKAEYGTNPVNTTKIAFSGVKSTDGVKVESVSGDMPKIGGVYTEGTVSMAQGTATINSDLTFTGAVLNAVSCGIIGNGTMIGGSLESILSTKYDKTTGLMKADVHVYGSYSGDMMIETAKIILGEYSTIDGKISVQETGTGDTPQIRTFGVIDGSISAQEKTIQITGGSYPGLVFGSEPVLVDTTVYGTVNIEGNYTLTAAQSVEFSGDGKIVSTGKVTVLGIISGTTGTDKIHGDTGVSTTADQAAYVGQYATDVTVEGVKDLTDSSNIVKDFIDAVQDGYKHIKIDEGMTLVGDEELSTLDIVGVTIEIVNNDTSDIIIPVGGTTGEEFTLNLDEVTIRQTVAQKKAQIVVEAGSSMDIVNSNLFIEVIVEDGATVDASNNKAESNNITGDVKVGYGTELTLSGKVTQGLNVYVWGTLIIAEGKTLDIDAGAKVVTYSGSEIIVLGTLNDAGEITIAKEAALDIDGTLAIGAPYGNAKLVNSGEVTVDGTLTVASSNNGMPVNILSMGTDFTVNGTLMMNGKMDGTMKDKGTVVINGTSGTTKVLLYDGVTLAVTSITGTLYVSDKGIMMDDYADPTGEAYKADVKVSEGNLVTITDLKGVSITEKVSSKVVDGVRNIWCDMYVAGNAALVSETNVTGTEESLVLGKETGDGVLSKYEKRVGKIIIDEQLVLGKYVGIKVENNVVLNGTITATLDKAGIDIGTDATLDVKGTVTATEKSGTIDTVGMSAAYYKVTDTSDGTWTMTYTNLDAALAAVADADLKTIDTVGSVSAKADATIASGSTVRVGGTLSVSKDVTVTLSEGAKMQGSSAEVSVSGTLVIENYAADASVKKITADVIVIDGNSRTYTSLTKAIEIAESGDTITTSGPVTIGESMTIPAGVTVASDYLVTVSKDVVLTVDGTLDISKRAEAPGIKSGTFKAADGEKEGRVVVNGTVKVAVGETGPAILTKAAGAHYFKTVGANTTYYVSNMEVAASNIDDTLEGPAILLWGTMTAGDVVFEKTEKMEMLYIYVYDIDPSDDKVNTNVNVDKLTLSGTALVVDEKGVEFNGVVEGESESGMASIDLDDASNIYISSESEEKADGIVDYVKIMTWFDESEDDVEIGSIKGTIAITSGTVTAEFLVVDEEETTLTIGAGATLDVPERGYVGVGTTGTTEWTAAVIVDGTVSVNKGELFVGGIMDVAGTLTVSESGDESGVKVYGTLNITGGLVIGAEENKEGYIVVDGTLNVGSKPESLGAAGTVTGTVTVDGGDVVVYNGTVEKVVKIGGTEVDCTTVYINGIAYMTVYSENRLSDVITGDEFDLEGLVTPVNAAGRFDGKVYSDADMTKEITLNTPIGDYDSVYMEFEAATVKGTISEGTGLNLYIDNVLYSALMTGLTVGTHDVRIEVEAGYDGSAATITFDGKVVTDGKITITADMKDFTLVASGAVPGAVNTTVPDNNDDDGMSLTDILLIVLVVLILIMAVIVAVRMMRS